MDVLRRAVLKFRAVSLAMTNIDPFRECVTISPFGLFYLKCNNHKEGMIGLCPEGGYFGLDGQSKVAIQWLEYEARRRVCMCSMHTMVASSECHSRIIDWTVITRRPMERR